MDKNMTISHEVVRVYSVSGFSISVRIFMKCMVVMLKGEMNHVLFMTSFVHVK